MCLEKHLLLGKVSLQWHTKFTSQCCDVMFFKYHSSETRSSSAIERNDVMHSCYRMIARDGIFWMPNCWQFHQRMPLQANFNRVKEPRGFIKILEFVSIVKLRCKNRPIRCWRAVFLSDIFASPWHLCGLQISRDTPMLVLFSPSIKRSRLYFVL
jgi:hypothetical protein